jgi:hypothetical protein
LASVVPKPGQKPNCRGIRDLKRDNYTGFDNLMNDYLITGTAYLIPILGKLFNNIINTGIDPELWVQSIIIPVFKKGDVNEPKTTEESH